MSASESDPDWDALEGRIAGRVIRPGAPGYEDAAAPAIVRFRDIRPRAVVRCETPRDVAATIAFAREAGLHATPRSGGHCFAGRSSTTGIVIDVSPMREVAVSGDLATVGAGARLADVYAALAGHGLTIPAGCGPDVGIAGLALGGGLGILGRRYGLTADQLAGARVVLADGRVVDCDERREPELFWALRGAGGGHFGVVTSLVLRTVEAPPATSFHLTWPVSDAVTVIERWQRWAPAAADDLNASLVVTASADPAEPPVIHLFGAMAGPEPDAAAELASFVSRVGTAPVTDIRVRLPYEETKRYLAERGPGEDRPNGHLVSRSEYIGRPLPRAAVRELVDALASGRVPGESRVLDLIPWGGAYNRVPAGATAFAHRDALFLLKHTAVVEPGDDQVAARRWVTRSWATARPWGTGGVYPGFPDPDLAEWQAAYHGTNFDRLVRAKARYDPTDFFRFHQSLPLPPRRGEGALIQMPSLVASGTLFVNGDRVLLVHRSIYENGWDIPGALVEQGRSPAATASAELYDDLGVDRFVGRLLVVDWAPGEDHDEFLYVFDGGALRDADVRLALGRNGLDRWAWVPVDQLSEYVPDNLARRFARAHKARAEGRTLNLENGDT